jgi:hypothetical protein
LRRRNPNYGRNYGIYDASDPRCLFQRVIAHGGGGFFVRRWQLSLTLKVSGGKELSAFIRQSCSRSLNLDVRLATYILIPTQLFGWYACPSMSFTPAPK